MMQQQVFRGSPSAWGNKHGLHVWLTRSERTCEDRVRHKNVDVVCRHGGKTRGCPVQLVALSSVHKGGDADFVNMSSFLVSRTHMRYVALVAQSKDMNFIFVFWLRVPRPVLGQASTKHVLSLLSGIYRFGVKCITDLITAAK